MSQPALNIDSKELLSHFYNTWHLGPCRFLESAGFLGYGLRQHLINMKPATLGTPYTPRFPRAATNWWRRVGIGTFPLFEITGQRNVYTWNPCGQPPGYPVWSLVVQGYRADDVFDVNGTLPWINTPYSEVAEARCTNKLLNAIKEDNGNLALAFLERKKTEKLFVDAVHSVGDQLQEYKQRHRYDWETMSGRTRSSNQLYPPSSRSPDGKPPEYGRKRNSWRRVKPGFGVMDLKFIPKSWLALQYGVLPLMADCDKAFQTLNRAQLDDSFWFSKEAKDSEQMDPFKVTKTSVNGLTIEKSMSRLDLVRMKVYYQIISSVLADYSSMGLTNPLSLVWESVPYSFVVDWFLPIGNWLNTFDATLGKSYLGGFKSQLSLYDDAGYRTINEPSVPGWTLMKRETDYRRSFARYFNRTKLTGFPTPFPPKLKNPFSPTHVANALSLLVSAYR